MVAVFNAKVTDYRFGQLMGVIPSPTISVKSLNVKLPPVDVRKSRVRELYATAEVK